MDAKMRRLAAKKAYIIDMDGGIYHGNRLLPGAKESERRAASLLAVAVLRKRQRRLRLEA